MLLSVELNWGSKGSTINQVGAQFMPGLLDANLCKNIQTNNNNTML